MSYYLYIIKLKSTGHFYIGVTSDINTRHRHHFLKIKSAICVRWQHKEPGESLLYKVFSEVIYPLTVDSWSNVDDIIKNSYSITVNFICENPNLISKKETDLIRRHKNNPLLLNTALKSTYATNKTSK